MNTQTFVINRFGNTENVFNEINEFCKGKKVISITSSDSITKITYVVVVEDIEPEVRKIYAEVGKGYGTSRYRVVHWDKYANKWRAGVSYKGKRITIGRFESEVDAALAYDEKARELMGKDAFLNFPSEVAN